MKLIKIVGAALSVCVSLSGFGQSDAQLLVDSMWLSQHVKDRNLVLIQVGTAAEFAKGHIPGARNLAITEISEQKAGVAFELPGVDVLQSKFEALGVSDTSRVVLYGGTEQPLPTVTRVAHILNFLGLGARTSLLDGGLSAWTKAGHEIVRDAPAVTPGKLTVRVNPSLFVDAEFVKGLPQKRGYKLIDARAPANYKGIEPTFGKAGHIPGAISIPFNAMNNDTQQISRDHVANVLKAAGIQPGDKLVVYCHVGFQATEVIFGARMLGYEAALYDGSFQDWAIHNRGGVEK